jgi:hypothetical protein|tara:strand:+ start:482 stop:2170 length:1689 start_codon:yes stop_codon:yes gene_type:complete
MADQTQIDKLLSSSSGTPDYNLPKHDNDFILLECSVHSPSGNVAVELNTAGRLIELNIFEDLFSNVLKGTLIMMDTQGLAETIPLVGDETLVISFLTPGGQGTQTTSNTTNRNSRTVAEEAVRQRFKIYDCNETLMQNRVKSYELFFVSEEYVYSSKTKVSKGYSASKYSVIVKDQMNKINKNIKSDYQKNIYIEETSTPQNVIVPNWSPLQAINFCAARSLSDDITPQEQSNTSANQTPKALGSLFVFYEKLGTGFFYESIETMIGKQKSQQSIPLYQYTPKTGDNRNTEIGIEYFGVEEFEVMSSFKTLENLKQGMFGSTLITYDPLRMKYDKIKYDYHHSTVKEKEELDERAGVTEVSTSADSQLDDKQRRYHDFIATDVSVVDNKQNKLVSTKSDLIGSNDTVIKLATTTKDHEYFAAPGGKDELGIPFKSAIGVSLTTFKDQSAKSNRVEDWLLQRQAQIEEFGSIVVGFTVSGNSSRHVGDLVRFEIPTTIPDDDPVARGLPVGHQLYSGYYIVSKIKHTISTQGYQTDIELIKNSFANRLPGQERELNTDGTGGQ